MLKVFFVHNVPFHKVNQYVAYTAVLCVCVCVCVFVCPLDLSVEQLTECHDIGTS
jgi:hypothetical protein